jgi:transglutaminase-like putative cysteine protease
MSKLRWLFIPGCAVLATFSLLTRADSEPAPTLDPRQPYQAERRNPVTYEVDFSAVVTPPYKAKVLRVWLPLPQSDAGQEVAESTVLGSFPMNVVPQIAQEPVHGNRFAYFEFANPEGAQLIRHSFKIKVWELHWNLDPARVASVKDWPKGFEPYLRGEEQSVVVDERFRKLAGEIVPQRRGPARDLADVMSWVNTFMNYDHVTASLRASSEHLLEKKMGHCSDYHGFCAAVGRAMGYPTRVTYGINPFPKNSPSHCKLEAYLPPYGWVSFDVSETQRLVTDIRKDPKLDEPQKERLVRAANERLASGFRDNTWFLQTRGTDYELAPPASKKAPVVRTIYAEADGVPLADPDPANTQQRSFAWMTVHDYKPDQVVPYPFKDWKTLSVKP